MTVKKAKNGRFYKKTSEGVRFISDAEAKRLQKKGTAKKKAKSSKRRARR